MAGIIQAQRNNAGILELLQRAVNAETTSRNLYWSRAAFWRGQGFPKLAKYYRKQSEEKHAQYSADRMVFLGQQPQITTETVPPVAGSLDAQFNEDVQVEANLAELYSGAITAAANVGDFVTEDIWRKVLKQTEEHVAWLQQQLAAMSEMGIEAYLAEWL